MTSIINGFITSGLDRSWNNLVHYQSGDLLTSSLMVKTAKQSNLFSRVWAYLRGGSFAKAAVAQSIHSFVTRPGAEAFLKGKSLEELAAVRDNLSALKKRLSLKSETPTKADALLGTSIEKIDAVVEGIVTRNAAVQEEFKAFLKAKSPIVFAIMYPETTQAAKAEPVALPEEPMAAPAPAPTSVSEIIEEDAAENCHSSEMRFGRCLRALMEMTHNGGQVERDLLKQALVLALPQIFKKGKKAGNDLYLRVYSQFFKRSEARIGWDPAAKALISNMDVVFRRVNFSPVHAERMQEFTQSFAKVLRGIASTIKANKQQAAKTLKSLKEQQVDLPAKLADLTMEIHAVNAEQMALKMELLEANEVPENNARFAALTAKKAELNTQYLELEATSAKTQERIQAEKRNLSAALQEARKTPFSVFSLEERVDQSCFFIS